MPAVVALPPGVIRSLLEQAGYSIIDEDEYQWAFVSKVDEAPVLVPRKCDLVPVEVAFDVARKVGFKGYFDAVTETV